MKKRWFLVSIVLVVLSLACESSGTKTGGSSSCSSSGQQGRCEGRYKKITGTVSETFSVNVYAGDALVDLIVSVGKGRMRVWFKTPDGQEVSAEAAPGTPAQLSAMADVETNFDEEYEITIHFEALDEEITDIEYKLNYQVN